MQVLHLHTYLNIACGITRVIFQITSSEEAAGTHHIITFGGNNTEKFQSAGIKISKINVREGSICDFLKIVKFVAEYCRRNDILIIHSHHRYFDLIAYFVSKILKVSTITTVHSKVRGKRLLSYKADYLVAVGENIKKHLSVYYKIKEEKISVINNFIVPGDYKTLSNRNLRNELKISEDYLILAFIGRISFEKGIDVLIKAYKNAAEINKKIALLIIGDGEAEGWLNNFIDSYRIPVVRIRPVQEIEEYYRISDIIILPSRVDPFPLVMLEAGYLNKAFIGTNVDGIAEVIENRENGVLIEPDNEAALAEAIELLSSDSNMRIKLSNNLRNKILNEYTSEIQMQKYFKLYCIAENDCRK